MFDTVKCVFDQQMKAWRSDKIKFNSNFLEPPRFVLRSGSFASLENEEQNKIYNAPSIFSLEFVESK